MCKFLVFESSVNAIALEMDIDRAFPYEACYGVDAIADRGRQVKEAFGSGSRGRRLFNACGLCSYCIMSHCACPKT